MANLTEQLATLNNRVSGLQNFVSGTRVNPLVYSAFGQAVFFGCKVTEGADDTDYTIALEGEVAGDEAHLNPDLDPDPLYPFQQGNIASLKAAAFYSGDMTAEVSLPPATGAGRYDIAYIAVGPTGPVFAVADGAPSAGVRTDFINNGLKTTPYDPLTDAALPVGAFAVARIYVEDDVTGIPDARIADIRVFGVGQYIGDIQAVQPYLTDIETAADNIAAIQQAQTYASQALSYRNDAANSAASAAQKANEASQVVSNDAIAAIEARFNYANVAKAIYVSNIGPWRTRGRGLSWYDTTKPSVLVGQNTAAQGQYANATAAVAAGGLVGEYFYNTTTKFWEEITNTGTPASTRIYAAGQADFPAEVVIVAAGTYNNMGVIIHDATVAGCPMWADMRLGVNITNLNFCGSVLWLGSGSAGTGLFFLDFARNVYGRYLSTGYATAPFQTWEDSSLIASLRLVDSTRKLLQSAVRAIATYTAPDAPIDPVSGEPIAYVAGATGGGVFVIKPDGTVIWSADTSVYDGVSFIGSNLYGLEITNADSVSVFGSVDSLGASFSIATSFSSSAPPKLSGTSFTDMFALDKNLAITHTTGIDLLRPNPNTPAESLIQKIGSNFNTGPYIDGAGSAAVMCDTTTGTIADTELVTNGTFDTDITGWSATNATLSHETDRIRVSATANYGRAWQTIATVVGETYLVTGTSTFVSGSNRSYLEVVSGDIPTGTDPQAAAGSKSLLFTAIDTSTQLRAGVTGSGSVADFDNISVKAVSADRSGNNLNFDVTGSLTRTAINGLPDAIAAYSGFSATDYLSSTDADLDADGVAYTIKGAIKAPTMSAIGTIVSTGVDAAGTLRELYLSASGVPTFDIGVDTGAAPGEYDDDKWHTFSVRSNAAGTSIRVDFDGERVLTDTGLTISAFTFADIRIGLSVGGDNPFPGSIAAVTIEVGVDESDSQITDWHRTMKTLIDNGNVTQPAAVVAADFITRSGQTLSATSSTVYRSTDTARISSEASTVGTIATVGAGKRGEIVVVGSTGLGLSIPARNLRETDTRPTKERYTIKYEGDATGSRVQFPLQSDQGEINAAAGGKPAKVWNAGTLQTEGAADDYTVKFDGFHYWVTFAVAPADGNDVIVEFEKEVYA